MPAVSKAQQKFMGMVHAAQKGDMENPSPEVAKAADSMSDTDAKDFASTSHKGLPDRIKEIVLSELRSVRAIQTDYSNVVDDIQKHLELYKKSKGTPEEKKHIAHLKTLNDKKKKLSAELNDKVSDMYKDAELKVDEMSTSAGAGPYNTPFAFSGKDSEEKKGKRQADLTGYSVVKESELKGYLAADVVDDIVKSIGSKFVSGEIKNAPNKNYIYLKLTDIKFGSGVVKMLKSQFGINAKVDKTFGNQPSVSFPSNKVISEAKQYKKGDKLKIKLPNGKKFDVVFVDYSRVKGVALGKFKDSHGEYDTKPFNLDTIVESVNEEKVYIDFLNKAKGFKQDRIKFNSYEAAVKWARKNFEKFNPDMIKYESVNEAIRNSPAKTGKELADFVLRWYDFDTNYIDDGGQRRRAIKSNEDISEWFDSHPIDLKKDAFKIIKSKMGSSNSSELQRVFGKSVSDK